METENFLLFRIRVYESIERVERQIDDTVAALKDKIRRSSFPAWNFNESPFDAAVARHQIHVADRLAFRTIVDISRCFGKDYKGMQRGYFNIGNGYQLWCPKLAVYIDGEAKSVARGWVNTLSEDWANIFERNDNPSKLKGVEDKIAENPRPRITFAQSTDILGRTAYRFLGVYGTDTEHPETSAGVQVYKRIAQYVDLAPWLETTS